MRALALLMLIGLLPVASAQAVVTDYDLARDMRLAQKVFPHACGEDRPAIGVDFETMLDGLDGYTSLGGEAGCWIVLNAGWAAWSPPVLCRVVVHEVGHLAGLKHTSNVRSIMYPTPGLSRSKVCRYP